MLSRMPIRMKLAAALAIPLVALLAVSALEVARSSRNARETRAQAQLATAALGPAGLVETLQAERNRAAIDIVGLGAVAHLPVRDNAEARARTDVAASEFTDYLEGQSRYVRDAFAPAMRSLGDLAQLRSGVDVYNGPRSLESVDFAVQVFGSYAGVLDTILDATAAIPPAVDDEHLRTGAELVDTASRAAEVRAQTVYQLGSYLGTGGIDSFTKVGDVSALLGRAAELDEQLVANGRGRFEQAVAPLFSEPETAAFNRAVQANIAGTPIDPSNLIDLATPRPDRGYSGVRLRVGSELSEEAATRTSDAVNQQRLWLLVAAVAVILGVGVTVLAARAITRPLRSLRNQADDMARNRLPEAVRHILDTPPGEDVAIPQLAPIGVRTHDEVSDVAAALNSVQTSAVDLAVEQAVLRRNISDSFLNLGRRNQNLLSRQLDYITELERQETDPRKLEELYRLDHLATRMRRNAESLLVLSGTEPARQWAAPVRVADVVRAALGEVEDYQRVRVAGLAKVAVAGSAAADVAHILAELVENALRYSPPDRAVEVRGRLGEDETYTLAIVDDGIGMSPEALEEANRRLGGAESFTVAPSKYLGHYVAGNLAGRYGIKVELLDPAVGGTTAKVVLPTTLLVADLVAAEAPSPAPAVPPTSTGSSRAAVGSRSASVAVPDAPLAAVSAGPQRELPPSSPDRTASGLVRRRRGEHMPSTQPLAARAQESRDDDVVSVRTPEEAAGSVSSFLVNFTDGVQRGREAARRDDGPDAPGDDRR